MARSFKTIKAQSKKGRYADDAALQAVAARAEDKSELLGIGSRPKLKRNAKLEALWKDLLADAPVNHSDSNNWRKPADVRPSSFPFCPRKYVMERLGLKMPSDFKVESCYYTEIGKAVHYVAQNALARTGRLWGFWKCVNPDCPNEDPRKIIYKKPRFLPEKCRFCEDDKIEYEEMRLEDTEIGLRGHTDGILVYKSHSSILEIKTAGQDKVDMLKAASEDRISLLFQSEAPWYGYWHQASTYATLANKTYPEIPPITCVDYMIFSRDSPKSMASFTLPVQGLEWYREIRARIVMAQEARSMLIVPPGFAKNRADIDCLPTCKWCLHKDVCLQPSGIRFAADALYDRHSREALDEVLEKERLWAVSSEET